MASLIRSCLFVAAALLLVTAAPAPSVQPPAAGFVPKEPAPKAFPRGAKRSPSHKLLSAPRYVPMTAPPAQFAVVPKKLSYWRNNVDGVCVTSESAFALAWYSTLCGPAEVFVPDAEVDRWARKYGYLNGAMLTDVMFQQQKDGFTVNGVNYKQGPYYSVNYSSETVLQSAISTGTVSIAIDANALPPTAGTMMGWYRFGKGHWPNTDHCVGIPGYGPASYVFPALGIVRPASIPADKMCYMLFTWNSIGVVDHDWLMSTCVEAWYRNPTTAGMSPPTPPPPPPPPIPGPTTGGLQGPDQDMVFLVYGPKGEITGSWRLVKNSLHLFPIPTTATAPDLNGFTGTLTYSNGTLTSVTPGVGRIKWLALIRDGAKLFADIQAANLPAMVPLVEQFWHDLSTFNTAALAADVRAILAAADAANLPVIVADVRAVLADLGLSFQMLGIQESELVAPKAVPKVGKPGAALPRALVPEFAMAS